MTPLDLESLEFLDGLTYDGTHVERVNYELLRRVREHVADSFAELTARRARDAEVGALVDALRHARDELASFPRSLGYAITALPKIDAALRPFHPSGSDAEGESA